jgi:TRAP-type C4-dicarboxylate transport system permease small subunit
MVAMREKGHLGVDTLVRRLPLGGKRLCFFLSEVMMLGCNVLFFLGTWKMHDLQVTNISVVVGISMIWIYGIGYVTSSVMAVMNLNQLRLLLTGRLKEEDLVMVVESEDTVVLDDLESKVKTPSAISPEVRGRA